MEKKADGDEVFLFGEGERRQWHETEHDTDRGSRGRREMVAARAAAAAAAAAAKGRAKATDAAADAVARVLLRTINTDGITIAVDGRR